MSSNGKMLGRLGWHGQCSCCNGPADDAAREEREWRREAFDECEHLRYVEFVPVEESNEEAW